MKRWVAWAALVLASLPLAASPWEGFASLTLAPDARSFATGGRLGEVLWWETSTGEVRARWRLPSAVPVVGLAFDAEGKTLAAAGIDGSFWSADPVSGTLTALARPPAALASARARWLAAAPLSRGVSARGSGWTLRGAPDGTVTATADGPAASPLLLTGHQAVVTGLVLGPGGTWFLSCSWDGTLVRWDLPSGRTSGRL